MNCQEVREAAAAALLAGQPWGALIDEHLASCDECRHEVEQLRAVTALLELAPPQSAEESPDELLLRRTLVTIAHERRRRRVLTYVSVAAALLIAVPAVAWMIASTDSGVSTQTNASTVLRSAATDPDSGVEGTAQLQPSFAGSELVVYVEGVRSGTRCILAVVDRAGERSVVDTWTADYAGDTSVTTQTSVPVSQIRHVELIDASADDLLLHFSFA